MLTSEAQLLEYSPKPMNKQQLQWLYKYKMKIS